MKLHFARIAQEASGLELEFLGAEGLRLSDWTMKRPDHVDFTGMMLAMLPARDRLTGLLVPPDLGGAGASAREAAVALEELGRAVSSVPFLTDSVTATVTVLAPEANRAAGELLAALAVPLTAAEDDAPALSSDAVRRGEEQVQSVAGALGADAGLVLVGTPGDSRPSGSTVATLT